jgi:glutamate racemase
MSQFQPIGVFDSGYGGLTVLKSIIQKLPGYDFIYLGDNARAPYGNRSFETVYQYTRECVQWFFSKGCPLVILACNTASAKALRTIQQQDLVNSGTKNKVLGLESVNDVGIRVKPIPDKPHTVTYLVRLK